MILTCPECATRYQTDAAQFTPDGRKVRCAKCSHVWFQAPPQPEAEAGLEEPAAETPPEPEAHPEPVVPKREATAQPRIAPLPESWNVPRRRSFGGQSLERLTLAGGWIGLGVVVLGVGWSMLHYRQTIASLWPQSSSLYAAVGMPVNTRGLEFRDKTAHFESEAGQDVLVITGDLANVTSRELSVPPIRVSLLSADRRELYHWNVSAGVATLHPGQLASFRTRLPSPPPAARHIELRFAAEHGN
jgi:predicted Zn finger-like uncharacterized protein